MFPGSWHRVRPSAASGRHLPLDPSSPAQPGLLVRHETGSPGAAGGHPAVPASRRQHLHCPVLSSQHGLRRPLKKVQSGLKPFESWCHEKTKTWNECREPFWTSVGNFFVLWKKWKELSCSVETKDKLKKMWLLFNFQSRVSLLFLFLSGVIRFALSFWARRSQDLTFSFHCMVTSYLRKHR